MGEAELEDLRRKIDEVDARIVALLNERGRLNIEVGQAKGDSNVTYSAARENEILRRLVAENPGPFPSTGLRAVYREIISACRSLQKRLRIAYPGSEHGPAMQAAVRQFGASVRYKKAADARAVVEAVETGAADYGVCPVTPGARGRDDLLAALLDSEVRICAQVEGALHEQPYRVIGWQMSAASGNDITALVFCLDDRVGALRDALAVLARHGLSLVNISSRPLESLQGRTAFFAEVSGHPDDSSVAEALDELGPTCSLLKVLGAWPLPV